MSISLHKHIFLWAILLFSLVSTAFASFPDVSENTKYNQSIISLQDSWIVNGYLDGSFGPDNTITRAEFLWIIFKSRAIDTTSYSTNQACFPDVASDTWYSKYICYAKDTGYVNGYEDGNFGPNNPISKLEAVAIISKVFEYDKPEERLQAPYSDVAKGQWYTPYIQWLKDKKILDEVWGNFEATTNLKRGQMAEWSYRAMLHSSDIHTLNTHITQNVWCEDQSINTNEATCLNIYYLKETKSSDDKDFLEPSTRQIEIPSHTSDLKLSYQWITEIHWLSQLKSLKTLDLGANYIQDIHFLKNVVSLEDLDLRDNWIWDLESLEDLTNLKKLNLNLNITGDPAPIWKLTNLEWLGLYKAEWLYHIDFLENLDNLKYLDVWEAVILDDELEVYKESHPEVEVSEDLSVFIGRKGDVRLIDREYQWWLYFSIQWQDELSEDERMSEQDKIMSEIEDELKKEMERNEGIVAEDKKYLSKEFFRKVSYYSKHWYLLNEWVNIKVVEEKLNYHERVETSSILDTVDYLADFNVDLKWESNEYELWKMSITINQFIINDTNKWYKDSIAILLDEIQQQIESDLLRKWENIRDYSIDDTENILIVLDHFYKQFVDLEVKEWKELLLIPYFSRYFEIILGEVYATEYFFDEQN